jgi:hypothetical protein
MKKMLKVYLVFIAFFTIIASGYSQVTTSGISGKVTSTNDESLPGATVVAVHQPSGTQYGTVSNNEGRFTLMNMRVGGPYTVTVSFVGNASKVYNDITLSLGSMADLQVKLEESTTAIDEVIVSATHGAAFSSERTGATTNITKDQVQAIPTISRGLKDFTKMSPLANTSGSGTSFAGSNNRYNQFAIDGIVNNDVFGLAASGTNGGQTGIEPISLDAIEEFQINIAPYDIRQGGFSGGGINAVTKSGSNKFSGSAYYYGNNESLVGQNNPNTDVKAKYPDYKNYQTGFTLGGPIIKNKLFFFVNAEMTRQKTPLAYEPGTEASKITTEEVERVLAVLKRVAPDYNAGDYTALNNETNSNKVLAKLNWNISDKHKLVLRHSYTYGENYDNSRGASSLRFSNNGVYFPSTTNSTGLELSSVLKSNISNKLLLGYTSVLDDREPKGQDFPTVLVNIGDGRTITAGSEYSSVANLLEQKIFAITDDLNIYKGKHTFTIGTHNEFYSFNNLFVQNIYGNYAYQTLADFETVGTATETAPSYYGIGYSFDATDNPSQSKGAAVFDAMQLGFYGQDEYQFTNDLKVTAGLRVDIPIYMDSPASNTAFNEAYASQGVATGQLPDSKLMWAPRVGFNWDVMGDKTLQIRGGTGIFTGRVPFVWVSNQFTNNGEVNGSYSVGSSSSSGKPITDPKGMKFVADPYGQPLAEDLGKKAGRGAINVIDQNFQFPQVFRSNIGIDKVLPGGVVGTVEGIYSKTYNNINFVNLNRQAQSDFAFEGVDKRPRYTTGSTDPKNSKYVSAARIDPNFEEIVKLENSDEGYSYNFVLQLKKDFKSGFNTMAAYTYGHSEDLNSGTSSVAYSNWRYVNNVGGLNDLKLSRSNFDMGSRIIGFVSYRKAYAQDKMSTQVSLFYTGQSGQTLSYIYDGDMNYDGTTNDLIYIPGQMSDINLVKYSVSSKDASGATVTTVVTPEEQWAKLNAYIEGDDYLSANRGGYAERNGARLPFQHQFDFKLLQEFNFKTGNITNKFQLSFDIQNIGNLINSDWGRQYFASNQQNTLIKYVGLEDLDSSSAVNYSNKPMFNYTEGSLVKGKPYSASDLSSRWRAQIGLRYIF